MSRAKPVMRDNNVNPPTESSRLNIYRFTCSMSRFT